MRAIGNDLHMDYSAIGQTMHLAARMEQLAMPGSILITPEMLRLTEGYVQVTSLGPVAVKGLRAPVEVYELVGAGPCDHGCRRLPLGGSRASSGGSVNWMTWTRPCTRPGAAMARWWPSSGRRGSGSRAWSMSASIRTARRAGGCWRAASVSYGKATPYFPVIDLLKRYAHIEDHDDARSIRAKVTGQVLTLDEALQDTIPALLALLDALPEDSPFLTLDPPQRRQRTLDALKRVLLRESQAQPLAAGL